MEIIDLENMTEAQINDAVREAVVEAWKGNTKPWDELCGLSYQNYPIFTCKQILLQKVLEARTQKR
jgi:hypothetical protein